MAASVVYTNFGGQIVHENRGGVERRYLADTLGSTIALTDSGTTVTDTWDYWPYGEVMTRTGTNPTPFTFVGTLGYFKDLLDKLFYVRARFYKPNYGRWLTVDPLWPLQSAQAYLNGRPVALADPSGLGGWPSPLPPQVPCTMSNCGKVTKTRNTRWSNRTESVGQSFGFTVGVPPFTFTWTGTSRVVRSDAMWTVATWKCVCYSGCKDLVPYWALQSTIHCKGTYLKEDIAAGSKTIIIREEYYSDGSPGCPRFDRSMDAGTQLLYEICKAVGLGDICETLKK